MVLPLREVETLAAQAKEGGRFELDLEAQLIVSPDGRRIPFEVNALKKRSLLEGLDDISLTLQQDKEIAAFQERDRLARPWIYDVRRD